MDSADSPRRYWNVMATLTVITIIGYVVGLLLAMALNKLDFAAWQHGMEILLLPLLGYCARMVGANQT